MSCNGCRVLRKGCSESCILRGCLEWIDNPEAQANATLFLAKFFGRSDLMSFISAVPYNQRPALFQSLLFEACGRTMNPVNGALGLVWGGNWHVCQAAVETILSGGTLHPIALTTDSNDGSKVIRTDEWKLRNTYSRSKPYMRNNSFDEAQPSDVNHSTTAGRRGRGRKSQPEKRLMATTSFISEASGVESLGSGEDYHKKLGGMERKLLNLFV